jgi:hypothetical protein
MLAILLAAASAAPDLTICADRPSKANGVCTVPVGHWQIEASAIDWTHSSDIDVTSIGQTFAKLGLSSSSDIEVGFTPYVSIKQPGSDASGVGDAVVRYKQRLTGADAPVQVALIPFVKLPTAAHSIGNGKVEGGLAVPLSTAVGKSITLTLGPEVDLLVDGDGHGYHAAITNLINLGWSAAPRLSLSAELWNNTNFDPGGTQRLWSADASAAYLVSNRLQLDAGANFGLNRATADIELYGGVSVLF